MNADDLNFLSTQSDRGAEVDTVNGKLPVVDVLLVEDNPTDAELTQRVLIKVGIHENVRVARDGAEALALLLPEDALHHKKAPSRPRLILLDLKLPKVDGLELLQRLKQDARTREIPVVVLTLSPQSHDISASYLQGANSYIVKPVNFDEFCTVIQQVAHYWLRLNQLPKLEDWR